MATNYEYITLQDTQVWWGLLWVPGVFIGLAVLVTILYTIFAKKRTADGYLYRLMIPLLIGLLGIMATMVPLNIIDSNSRTSQINEELNKIFPKASYESDNEFVATTDDDVQVRGVLVKPTEDESGYKYAVLYVPIEVSNE